MTQAVLWASCLALVAGVGKLSAQGTTPSRIVGITLERHNVFDESESSFWGTRLVNKLHITTRPRIISRELLFAPGDLLDSLRLAETERNLRRLGVFRSVAIDTIPTDSGMIVKVTTSDGWSTRLDFRFRSTGGTLAYTAALIEDNLFGTVTQTQVLYRKEPDRTTTILQFRQPRLISGKVGTSLIYFDRSDGALFAGSISHPYYSNSSSEAIAADFDTRRERVLLFRDGDPVASDTVQRRYVLGRLSAGKAIRRPPGGYTRVGVVAQLRRDDYASQTVADLTGGIPTRSVTAAIGGVAETRRGNYLKVSGYQSFGREEDVDLSRVVRISVMLAPAFLGYSQGGVAPGISLQSGARIPGGFLQLDARAAGLFTRSGLDSGGVHLGATAVFLPSPKSHLVFHAEAGMLRRPLPGAEFDLGFGVGPRAFTEHAFTGDRQYFVTAEYRRVLAPDLFKLVGVGVAAFADHGGAGWQSGRIRSGSDVGIGLRLGASRANDPETSRIDLARRFGTDRQKAGWVVVIGKGFVFGPRP